MGTLESDIGKYIGYMFGRIFEKWVAQNPQLETYIWPIFGVLLVGALMVAAVQAGRNREVLQPEPAPHNAVKLGTKIQHLGIELKNTYKTVYSRFHDTVQ